VYVIQVIHEKRRNDKSPTSIIVKRCSPDNRLLIVVPFNFFYQKAVSSGPLRETILDVQSGQSTQMPDTATFLER
jgi:hypothetical protein